MAAGNIKRVALSGSTNAKFIAVAATATTIHTADVSLLDEIWCWAYNSTGAARTLTVSDGTNTFPVTLPASGSAGDDGAIPIFLGSLTLTGGAVLSFTGDATGVRVSGHVNRITNAS